MALYKPSSSSQELGEGHQVAKSTAFLIELPSAAESISIWNQENIILGQCGKTRVGANVSSFVGANRDRCKERGAYAPMSTGFAAQAKLDQLEPSCANAIVQYANISKPSWISWYAFSARDEAIQALINEAKSYYMRFPPIQHLQQLPLLQSPSTRYDYESPSLYLEPQFQSLNIPGDGLPRDYLNAQVNVLGSDVHEMHNQRQSHPRGRHRDFFGEGSDFTIYITINFDGGRLTKENIWDYFKKFGPVINVYLSCKPGNEKYTFGFVTFENADTVSLLLSKSTPHFIFGVKVRVKRYLEWTKQEQRKLPQENDHFDNVAHRTSCANAFDGMPRDYLNAQVLGSGVPELHNQRLSHPRGSQRDFFGHNQRQSHPHGSQRDFFGQSTEFTIYITIAKNILTWKNIRDYFKQLPQRNDRFDNVAHRTSCDNAIEGHSGQKMPNFIELSQETLTHQFGDFDSPLTHNLSEKKTESPEGPGSKYFSIEFHHGGFFCGMGVNRTYMDGKVDWFDNIDSRDWGRCLHLADFVAMLGYDSDGKLKTYWLLPGKNMSDGLRIIDSEVEINVMKSVSNKIKNFVIYFDHTNHVSGRNIDDIVLSPEAELPEVFNPSRQCQQTEEAESEDRNPRNAPDGHVVHEELDVDDSESDSDFVDSDYEWEDDDDDLFEENVDGDVEEGDRKKFNHKKAAGSVLKGKKVVADLSEGDTSDDEQLHLPSDDDDDEFNLKFKSFNPEDINNPIFKVGMVFSSVELVRKAISEYSMKNRVDIKMPRNDRTRIKAHCAEGCPWNFYASMDSRAKAFIVKTYEPHHKCKKEWILKRCTAKWLAEKYTESFRADGKMTIPSFAKTVQKEWNLTPSRSKLARARRLALKEIYGDEIAQYNLLWDYGNELRRSNPGSSFYLRLDEGKFSSLYFSLDVCKRGFLSGCRPIICLDGCHIKTKFGGQLLTAVGIDPNDCIYPIAMAVVEVESFSTWTWFLDTLKTELGIVNTSPWTIMTDKQKVTI
ncbi:Os07g0583500 [Oryza sativa Japonica Group]|uniref:Os07g0583500 protein n=1 Tax=Oryza sativa subsp. japonica TaxID=39947 RepID=C7J570_ORYSJ|nr:Os07g0583500 [Oryza sativa Japonica Group]|eukprot:NP_001175275.1 Os07g0583500 [Oryza sativa Japonica Group]